MIKAGLFMRVSTKDQHTENQKEALIQLISDRNYELAKIYDVTASATGKDNLESSYLDEVYEDARLGIINVLVVWALDRLTRRGDGYLLKIFKDLGKHNVRVVSYREGFIESITDPSMRNVFLSFWEFINKRETEQRSERQKAAIKLMRKQGKKLGRPKGAKDKKTRVKLGYFGNDNKTNKRRS